VKKTATYIFLHEARNLDFSSNGTRFFVLGALTMDRPSHLYADLAHLKYELIEQGVNIEYFHAAEDRQLVRDRVFDVVRRIWLTSGSIRSSWKSGKPGRHFSTRKSFYPRMLGYLLRFVIEYVLDSAHEIIVFTDRLPIQRKRRAIEKAVKQTLATVLPRGVPYRVYHDDSKSNFGLQVAGSGIEVIQDRSNSSRFVSMCSTSKVGRLVHSGQKMQDHSHVVPGMIQQWC
jgi:Protein of unknown function (DUF3800)